MSPAEIVARLERAGLRRDEIHGRAGIGRRTLQRIVVGQVQPRAATLARLVRALAELEKGRTAGRAPADATLIEPFYRAAMVLVATARGLDPDQVLGTDFTVQRPGAAAWLAAAQVRRMAIYLVTVEFEIGNARLARIIGCSRQNVQQARNMVEDLRDRPEIDALLDRIAGYLRGARP